MSKIVQIIRSAVAKLSLGSWFHVRPESSWLSQIERQVAEYEALLGTNHPDVRNLRLAFEELKKTSGWNSLGKSTT